MNQGKFNFNIDPHFSVYRLVKRSRQDFAVINQVKTMRFISHEIENIIIDDEVNTVIFAGFQYYSRFLPQISQYRKMAEKAHHVYVIGVPDAPVPTIENITYVPITSNDQLAKEWFVVAYGHDFFTALATEELPELTENNERQFVGIWTFEKDLVSILHDWLHREIDDSYDDIRNTNQYDEPDWKSQLKCLTHIIRHTIERIENSKNTLDGLSKMLDQSLYPTLDKLSEQNSDT